jgi:hypothetical protein
LSTFKGQQLDDAVRTKLGTPEGYYSRMGMKDLRTIDGMEKAIATHLEGDYRVGLWISAHQMLNEDQINIAEESFVRHGSVYYEYARGKRQKEYEEEFEVLRSKLRHRKKGISRSDEEDRLTKPYRRQFGPR